MWLKNAPDKPGIVFRYQPIKYAYLLSRSILMSALSKLANTEEKKKYLVSYHKTCRGFNFLVTSKLPEGGVKWPFEYICRHLCWGQTPVMLQGGAPSQTRPSWKSLRQGAFSRWLPPMNSAPVPSGTPSYTNYWPSNEGEWRHSIASAVMLANQNRFSSFHWV